LARRSKSTFKWKYLKSRSIIFDYLELLWVRENQRFEHIGSKICRVGWEFLAKFIQQRNPPFAFIDTSDKGFMFLIQSSLLI